MSAYPTVQLAELPMFSMMAYRHAFYVIIGADRP